MKNQNLGILLCVVSALFIATSNVTAKYLLQYANPETAAMLWFLSACVSAAAISFFSKIDFRQSVREYWKHGLLTGFASFVAVLTWFYAIDRIGPALTGFLSRFETLFLVVLGILLLKEKFRPIEIIGFLLAISGALLITLGNNSEFIVVGSVFAIISALAISAQNIFAKSFVKDIHPAALLNYRIFVTALLLTVYVLGFGKFQPVPLSTVPLFLIASALSASIGFFLFFSSLKYLDASKAGIIRNIDPFAITLYTFLIFNTLPTLKQTVGGILIVAGVAFLMFHERLKW